MEKIHYEVGDVVRMKKQHPCGSDLWEILRTGMDFGIKCKGCGRFVMLPRPKFEKMAKEDTYIDEAYEMLKHMSADEKKRLEYEAREKAIRDYNSQMLELKEVGRKEGIAIGAEQGEQRKAASIITNMLRKGKGSEEIADMTGENLEEIQAIQKRLL